MKGQSSIAIIIILIVLAAIGSTYYVTKERTTTTSTTTTIKPTTTTIAPENITEEIQECIEEKQELYGSMEGIVLGHMVVIFEENVTEEEAITLLKSYNLSIEDNSFPSKIEITFPEGTEIKWKCILEENEIVKHGALFTTGGIATATTTTIPEITLSITKEFEINKINSLTFDGNNLWGTSSLNTLSKINITSGEIISNCSLPFDSRGVVFNGKYLWVTAHRSLDYGLAYKINPKKCDKNESCNYENDCILTSWEIERSQYPRGMTFDGDYLYILEQHPQSILKFDLNGTFIESFKAPDEILGDITWDEEYFWIVGSNGYTCAGWCGQLPPDYFKIYQYDKDFNLIFESNKFERTTLDFFGITNDGNSLWVSDRYNDRIYQIK